MTGIHNVYQCSVSNGAQNGYQYLNTRTDNHSQHLITCW